MRYPLTVLLLSASLCFRASAIAASGPPAPARAAKGTASRAEKSPPLLPPLLQEVEAQYAKTPTLLADFLQINTSALTGQKKTSSGNIAVKRPGKVRWQTTSPQPNLLVSDGHRVWFYTPPFDEGEHGQVTERKSSQVQGRLAEALLSGHFSLAREMKIEQSAPNRFILTPKKGKSADGVTEAQIEIDPEKKLIQKVTLANVGGNTSEITLSNIRLGVALEDGIFVFTPPPNTDRVKE